MTKTNYFLGGETFTRGRRPLDPWHTGLLQDQIFLFALPVLIYQKHNDLDIDDKNHFKALNHHLFHIFFVVYLECQDSFCVPFKHLGAVC